MADTDIAEPSPGPRVSGPEADETLVAPVGAAAAAAPFTPSIDPVDEVLAYRQLAALGLQHVLVMYAGAIAVPLIIGRALKLPAEQIALLINADLLGCGIATVIQSFGLAGIFGIRLPVMMGATFVAVGPMLAMAADPSIGLAGIFGAIIVSGVFTVIVAQDIGYFMPLFPPVVTGTIIFMIGVTLMRVGVNWAAGAVAPNLPGYGDPLHLGMALFVLATILLITRYAKGYLANIAVLLGIVIGSAVAAAMGQMSFAKVAAAPWFQIVQPLQFGTPTFLPGAVIPMCVVMIVVMIESSGMFLAVGEMTGRPARQDDVTRGLRANGLGTIISGVFNSFALTSFSQNIGLVGVTGVRSRYVCVAGGLILVAMGCVPKLGALVEAIPIYVLGGAGVVMFGMVSATGLRILSEVDFKRDGSNLLVVGIAVAIGLIPLLEPTVFAGLPPQLGPFLNSGILLTALAAVILNFLFNGLGRERSARMRGASLR